MVYSTVFCCILLVFSAAPVFMYIQLYSFEYIFLHVFIYIFNYILQLYSDIYSLYSDMYSCCILDIFTEYASLLLQASLLGLPLGLLFAL